MITYFNPMGGCCIFPASLVGVGVGEGGEFFLFYFKIDTTGLGLVKKKKEVGWSVIIR